MNAKKNFALQAYRLSAVLAPHERVPRVMDQANSCAVYTRRNFPHPGGCPGSQLLTDAQRCQNQGPVRLLVSLLEFKQERNIMSKPIDPATRIGHVHLKVSDLERALAFYCGVLGLELQQRYGSEAAFVSAGGYHHHIGFND